MSPSARIFRICAGMVIHVAVFLAAAAALFIIAQLQPDIHGTSAALQCIEYVWTLMWSWRGRRFALLLLANIVGLPAIVGGWLPLGLAAGPQDRFSRMPRRTCVIAAYPVFVIGTEILIVTASFRIGAMARWSFLALYLYVLVIEILFAPLTVLSHRIVRAT